MAVRLTPFAEAHLPHIVELVDDPDTGRFTRIPVPPPPGFPRAWLDMYEMGRRDGTREAFAVVSESDGAFLGVALAPVIETDERTVELGYVIMPSARGRGVATGALRLLTEWAFSELGAERAELLISVDNTASKLVAERSGYVREGVMRSTYFKNGQRIDAVLMSRIASDPPPPP